MTKGVAMRAWLPPERLPKESKRHYLAILDNKMERLLKMAKNTQYTKTVRERSQKRYDQCVKARDRALTGCD